MKAQISQLWETGIQIITTGTNEISSFADLRKCENVLVGKKGKGLPTEVMIDDEIVFVSFRTVSHPTGCGKLRICEIA